MDKCVIFDFSGVIVNSSARLAPGIDETIKSLSAKYLLTIISSTSTNTIKQILVSAGLDEFFAEILGYDGRMKSEKMRDLLQQYGLKPSNCVMITDTVGDIEEASAVAIPSVGVSWGFEDGKALLKANSAISLANTPPELTKIVNSYLN